MPVQKKLLSPLTILMIVVIIAAIATWIISAGKYDTLSYSDNGFTYSGQTELRLPATQQTLDSLHVLVSLEKFKGGSIRKPVSIPGTYRRIESNRQGLLKVLQAPIKGLYDSIDVVFFILVIGGFIYVFNETGAMVKGLAVLSHRMKGKESWLIIILTFLFSFGGSSYGMAEEGLVFYPILVPVFLAAGYDLLVPVAVIYGGTQLGTLSSFSNPFSTIIASNAAGVSWTDGVIERVAMFVVSTAVYIWYIVRYANGVKKDPSKSLVLQIDGNIVSPYPSLAESTLPGKLDVKTRVLLFLFLATFLTMIGGVVFMDWWLLEMTTLFLISSVLTAIIASSGETLFIRHFIKGMESMVAVSLIIAIARGATVILNEGHISDTIIHSAANLISHTPPTLFIIALLLLYMLFTLFIASSSGMAVLTMPIMGALAILVNIPGHEIVNAYLFGMGIMGFITPTGLILPSLALVNVSIKAWLKFIYPLMLILLLLCILFLVVGINK